MEYLFKNLVTVPNLPIILLDGKGNGVGKLG